MCAYMSVCMHVYAFVGMCICVNFVCVHMCVFLCFMCVFFVICVRACMLACVFCMYLLHVCTLWRETLAAGKFGEFVTKFVLAEENLANLSIIYTAKLQCKFGVYH